jgi:glycosyltransferase involved in cell wall biosynthesis
VDILGPGSTLADARESSIAYGDIVTSNNPASSRMAVPDSVSETEATPIAISVIAPVFDEEDNIRPFTERVVDVMEALGRPYEIILINDGSRDRSLERLKEAAERFPAITILNLARNFGQTAAMMAGIDAASGEIIVPIDADLQNDPQDIPLLLAELEKGFDVVSGWRRDRKDAPIRRNLPSRLANRFISILSGVYLHDYGCSLKAYRRSVLQDVRLYGEMHRFIPIYASWEGGRVAELPVRHHARTAGKSKYGLARILKVVLDLLVVKFFDRHMTKPIYIFGGFGLAFIAMSLVSGIYALWLKFGEGVSFISTPLPLLVTLTLITGVMSFLMGLLAEIMIRTYYESQGKKTYVVKNILTGRKAD